MIRRGTMAAFFLAVLPTTAAAQSVAEGVVEEGKQVASTIWQDFSNGAGDVWHVWTAPFHATPGDWAGAALTVGAAAAVSPFDDNVDAWIAGHQHTALVQAFDPVREAGVVEIFEGGEDEAGFSAGLADIGSGHKVTRLSGVLYLAGLIGGSPDIRNAGLGCIAAVQGNALPRTLLYDLVGRERPATAGGDQYDFAIPGDGDDWNDNSFFGGHGANAMACATFWNERFDLGYAEPLIWAVGIGVGAGRVLDRRHWVSDAIIGTVWGYAAGKAVAARSRRRAEAVDVADSAPDESDGPLGFLPGTPVVARSADGVRMGWLIRF